MADSAHKTKIVTETMERYHYMRDCGHTDFVKKADECDGLFSGQGHWEPGDRAMLEQARKPVLTINTIIQTMAYVMGNQIQNATSITFHPRRKGATDHTATILSKVFRQIGDNNRLKYLRSELFSDGMITSRGFLDARMDYSDSLTGEVRVKLLDPRSVLIDPEANSYEPSGWKDVITVQYMTIEDIEALWGKAQALKVQSGMSTYPGENDDHILSRQTFGTDDLTARFDRPEGLTRTMVVERQYRKLTNSDHYVWVQSGDIRPVPEAQTEAERQQFLTENPDVVVTKRVGFRIRWVVVANSVLLHDDWSPYENFTVVPYFPYFRRGTSIGIVENLRDPQRLLNKTTSQELHILNSTANGGWKVQRNNLSNMSVGELEERGGEAGIVIEVETMDGLEKLQPNQIPSGLDRIAFKADEYIKAISGVTDYMRGSAREDVSAKSVVANQSSGAVAMVKPLDNLTLSDELLARHILSMVQAYYSDERVLRIVSDPRRGTTEDVIINQVTQNGVLNDLTVGEYDIVMVNTPQRELDEDTEFEQLLRMRGELQIPIPDEFIIRASRLRERAELLEAMSAAQANAQQAQQQQEQALQAADIDSKVADAELKRAKAAQAMKDQPQAPDTSELDVMRFKAEMELKARELASNIELKNREFTLKEQESAQKREDELMNMRLQARNKLNPNKENL